MDEVLLERDGHVASLVLNRPERMNTISQPMIEVRPSRHPRTIQMPSPAALRPQPQLLPRATASVPSATSRYATWPKASITPSVP